LVYSVILAGGKGERFWPLSRTDRPKQFLCLTSDKMMLEETIERVLPMVPVERTRIITGSSMAPFILEQIDYLKPQNILSEPVGRNTCGAIGFAATHLIKEDPDAIMVVLSADHLIRPAERLLEILEAGANIASVEDRLMTIGIVPTRPETGYGYIKLGDMYKHEGNCVVHQVGGFAEKPRAPVAQEYYYSRNYLWNSGMFVWSAKSILAAIEEFQPEMGALLKVYSEKIGTNQQEQAAGELYTQMPSISIDVAILEKAVNVLTIKADIVWDDVGGWSALERYKDRDSDNNVIEGKATVVDTYETTICNHSDGIVTCLGVVHKTRTQEIKKLLQALEENEDTRHYL